MQTEARKHLSKGLMNLIRKTPFYTSLILKHKIIESDKINAIMATNGVNLIFHPSVLELKIKEMTEILKHEAMHIANKHHIRMKLLEEKYKKDIKDNNIDFRMTFNIAADLAINSILDKHYHEIWEESEILKGGCIPGRFPFNELASDKSCEFYFHELIQSCKEGADPTPSNSEIKELCKQNADSDKEVKLQGEVLVNEEDSVSEMEKEFEKNIAGAIQASKQAGTNEHCPLLKRLMNERDHKVNLNWRSEMQRFFSQTTKGKPNYKKPNRRNQDNGIIMPSNKVKEPQEIILLLDTSGSMSDECVMMVYEHIEKILSVSPNTKLRLVPFDDEIFEDHIKMYDRSSIPIKNDDKMRYGCGSTRFCPALDYASNTTASGIIMLTDMMPHDQSDFLNYNIKIPTLFVSVFLWEYDINMKKTYCVEPKWANICYIKKEENK